MKNQYFGDVGDYGKYGLLRFIAKRGVTIAVNGYLTPDDQSNEGHIRGYLTNDRDRKYDPELFDVLREMSIHKEKNVGRFAEREMIPGTIYFDSIVQPQLSDSTLSVTDKRLARERWHQQAQATGTGTMASAGTCGMLRTRTRIHGPGQWIERRQSHGTERCAEVRLCIGGI